MGYEILVSINYDLIQYTILGASGGRKNFVWESRGFQEWWNSFEKVKTYDKIILSPGPGIPEAYDHCHHWSKNMLQVNRYCAFGASGTSRLSAEHSPIFYSFITLEGNRIVNLSTGQLSIIWRHAVKLWSWTLLQEAGWLIKNNFPWRVGNKLLWRWTWLHHGIAANKTHDAQGVQFHPGKRITPSKTP